MLIDPTNASAWDVERHGEYRTKLAILRIYDAMHEAIDTGVPYRSELDASKRSPAPPSPASEGAPA